MVNKCRARSSSLVRIIFSPFSSCYLFLLLRSGPHTLFLPLISRPYTDVLLNPPIPTLFLFGYDLKVKNDGDYKVQGTYFRNLKVRVHLGRALQTQGLNQTSLPIRATRDERHLLEGFSF